MTRTVGIIAVLLVAFAAVSLYRFKEHAAELSHEVQSLRAEIAAEHERISLLNAEWTYLNQPDRIQELSQRHLDLQRVDAAQIGNIDSLPMRPIEIDPFEGDAIAAPQGGRANQ